MAVDRSVGQTAFFEPIVMGILGLSSIVILGASGIAFRILGGPSTDPSSGDSSSSEAS